MVSKIENPLSIRFVLPEQLLLADDFSIEDVAKGIKVYLHSRGGQSEILHDCRRSMESRIESIAPERVLFNWSTVVKYLQKNL